MESIKRSLLLAAALLLLAAPALADDGRGEELFELCAQCHGEQGGGKQLVLAPPIAGLSEWYIKEQLTKYRAGIRGNHPDDQAALRMYPMSLYLDDDAEVDAVASYVSNLPPQPPPATLEGGDPVRGEALYTPCKACHGAQAEGLQALGGPNLRVSADWYMLRQLEHFKNGMRGANPRDITGMRMRPMSMTLVDEQAMKDVISYILTLQQ
jgi:cytochrome c oxidase subunit 2